LTLVSLVVISTPMTSSASAGSLLGGYGGPGEGDQAILGSALLGGGGGAAGGFSGPTGSSPSSAAGAGVQAGGGASGSRGKSGEASGGAARAYPTISRGETSQAVAEETLGLSGDDLPLILLALGALAFTAVLTRQLTRITATGRHHGS